MQAHDSWIMENSLIPHMQENKGLFLAWAVMYLDIWKRIYSEASGIIMSILSRVFEEAWPQQRWLKGVTSVVLDRKTVTEARRRTDLCLKETL